QNLYRAAQTRCCEGDKQRAVVGMENLNVMAPNIVRKAADRIAVKCARALEAQTPHIGSY
ncbi:unnamed protein product, partial [marine sediment metagenome]